ncbi:MAG: DUF1932 domain-containing protein [Maricaulaceae bacterium]|jgi:3-hydroxyisobutyrate dehydrogenase-like beta-hydroxyacid dehydrogenase
MTDAPRIALIGFGEVGQILAADLKPTAAVISAWDLLFANTDSGPSKAATDVRRGSDAADAVRDTSVVISAVTAAQTVEAARSAAEGIEADAFYLDLNSASPAAKADAAELIETAGGRYVEAAVMSPVPPKRLTSPILLGGPCAEAFLPVAQALGFSGARVFSSELGKASAAKMCRSVMVKGIEALLAESLITARGYRVEADVLASLDDLLPGPDWPKLARYMISRSLQHGVRRAEEMREAAKTVEDAGLDPHMSAATAERQAWAANFAAALSQDDLNALLDAIREQIDLKGRAA